MAGLKLSSFLIFLFVFALFCSNLVRSGMHISLWNRGSAAGEGEEDIGFDPTKVTQVSWRPRAFIYKGFLTPEECDHLIKLGKVNLQKSMVADNESGKSIKSEVRTSSGSFLNRRQDAIVARIEKRIAAWTFLPEENGEAIQILHYKVGQKYDAHFDYFRDKTNQQLGGHRMATALMYLADVARGGETVFPSAEGKHRQLKDDMWSDCAKNGLAVKPRKGDTLLFFSCHLNATTDPLSLHASCPVIEGEKWSATRWIHLRSFERTTTTATMAEENKPRDVRSVCGNYNQLCSHWASIGECEKNALYMIGTEHSPGYCRKSCNACSAS